MTAISLPPNGVIRQSTPDFRNVRFGYDATDHQFIAEYKNGEWQNARIEPFGQLSLSPFTAGFHYGQTVFEGMKAYRLSEDAIQIFRPQKHVERLNKSLHRMCMPLIPEGLFMEALGTLLALDAKWVSPLPGQSLYIRPFVMASEARIGARASSEFLFMIVCSPMDKYYDKNLRVKVETQYVRAVSGGVGYVKCGGNYGGAFYPARLAQQQGFDQVLWTDGKHNKFIEESGTMNVMFVIDDRLVTPPLDGTILDGVTRDTVLTIARDLQIPVEERPISYKELLEQFAQGKKVEAFGVGTAASLTPIELIHIEDRDYFTYVSEDALLYRLRKELDAIRNGLAEDKHGWNYVIYDTQLTQLR